jgi:predicted DCC family thiol-disulfide oxidoreductase YuxK
MDGGAAQRQSDGHGDHLLLYDGVCGLCTRSVRFVLAHDRMAAFDFASLQSPTGRALVEASGRDPEALTTFVVCANYRTSRATVLSKARAVLFLADTLGWPWKTAAVVRLLPILWLDRLYDLLARHRYRVFGRSDRCFVPSQEFRNRFVDS